MPFDMKQPWTYAPAYQSSDFLPLISFLSTTWGFYDIFWWRCSAAHVIAHSLMLEKQRPLYMDAYAASTYNLQERVRKLWFKLRLVVRCGWVKVRLRFFLVPSVVALLKSRSRRCRNKFRRVCPGSESVCLCS